MLRKLILMLAILISGNILAQNQKELSQLMLNRGEYYFTLAVQQPSEIQEINKLCSVDGFDGKNVVCYANQQQYDKLLAAGYQPTLQTPPSMREEAKMWDGSDRATYDWDSYPTYSAYESMMNGFPSTVVSGRTCTLLTLGTLTSGRKVMGVRINNGSPAGKPKFLYSSTIHGDETTGWIMMLRLIDELCTSTDSRIVNLVNNLDIFIFPNTNPDGTYYGGNNSVSGARRANANNIDMNRNYPDPHGSEHPDGNAYQTETNWFMRLAETYNFTMAANYHGGAEVMNYPWDNTYTRHADDAWWQLICKEYANLAHQQNSSYMVTLDGNSNPSGITNGADWYMIGGGRQDYMNGYRQCREVTIECSTTKNPNASQLPNFWNYNHNSILALLEQCLNGIHGVVKDADTRQPIVGATITIQSHDDDYSYVKTHEVGDFHRPIKGGSWTLVISKDGYNAKTVNVTVADGNSIDLGIVYLTRNVTPSFTLVKGWNWWSPSVDMNLYAFEAALGSNFINIIDENGNSINNVVVGKMYKVQTSAGCTVSVSGVTADPNEHTIILNPGANHIGIIGTEAKTIGEFLGDFTPTDKDYIKTQNGVTTYYQSYGGWRGSVTALNPGEGFIYFSNASSAKTINQD